MTRCLIIVAIAFACIATAATDTITVTNCNDAMCKTGCQSQNFTANQCLREENTPNTVELSCYSGATMCAKLTMYADAQCAQATASMTNVCNSCQFNYTLSCGAVHDGLFWVANCTDTACDNCGGATIVSYGQCKNVNNGLWVIIHSVTPCVAVNVETFPGTQNCASNNATYNYQYPSGDCSGGTIMTCNKGSQHAIETVRLPRH